MSTLPAAGAALPQPVSPLARIAGVFIAPSPTFEDLARRPGFLFALCLQAAVGAGYFYFLLHRLGPFNMARQTLVQSARGRAMDPAMLAAAIAASAKVFPYALYATPVLIILGALFLGWVFQGVANLLLGQEATYSQTLGLVCHANLTQALLALLSGCVLALTPDPSQFQFTNPVATNLAYFLDRGSASPFLYALFTHLDLFTFWTVLLLALGLAKLGGRNGKFSSAFWVVFGLWILYVLTAAGLAAVA